jgi:hypothetical protein
MRQSLYEGLHFLQMISNTPRVVPTLRKGCEEYKICPISHFQPVLTRETDPQCSCKCLKFFFTVNRVKCYLLIYLWQRSSSSRSLRLFLSWSCWSGLFSLSSASSSASLSSLFSQSAFHFNTSSPTPRWYLLQIELMEVFFLELFVTTPRYKSFSFEIVLCRDY